ncbi:hypothetical protein [Metallibacterium scheffleri]|uniref:Uncharacterized protein n=1 Tax=Metallibacterium scheffleri TaxID=993689 RepID=A0A4S3KFQ9_9GAMM|nr:hypothetical protein [Metallibacterium scheffleri]THD06774.1 hypothetical protein B1806_15715 [Metallibacterium scheffleri]
MSTPKPQSTIMLCDPDLQKVLPALRRAAHIARELALRTGTPCHVWLDGKMVNIGAPLPAKPAATK